MINLTAERKKEIRAKFDQEVLHSERRSSDYFDPEDYDDDNDEIVFNKDAFERENDPAGVDWGGYLTVDPWANSCGNMELCGVSDGSLPVKEPDEMAYWLTLIKKTFKKYDLGNLFISFPSDIKTGKPLNSYRTIGKACERAGFKRVARSKNPYHHSHYQDTYLIYGG
jgi:hypothetical protein